MRRMKTSYHDDCWNCDEEKSGETSVAVGDDDPWMTWTSMTETSILRILIQILIFCAEVYYCYFPSDEDPHDTAAGDDENEYYHFCPFRPLPSTHPMLIPNCCRQN